MRQQYTANEMFMGQKKLWSIFLIPPSLSNMVVVLDRSAVKKKCEAFSIKPGKIFYCII